MTKIALPEDLEAWAREEVAAGRAHSVEEFVAQVLRDQQTLVSGHRALVEEAYRDLSAGRVDREAEVDAELDRWIAEDLAAAR